MVSEPRNELMAWMETDYSKHAHFQWKIRRQLEDLSALGIMRETAPLILIVTTSSSQVNLAVPQKSAFN